MPHFFSFSSFGCLLHSCWSFKHSILGKWPSENVLAIFIGNIYWFCLNQFPSQTLCPPPDDSWTVVPLSYSMNISLFCLCQACKSYCTHVMHSGTEQQKSCRDLGVPIWCLCCESGHDRKLFSQQFQKCLADSCWMLESTNSSLHSWGTWGARNAHVMWKLKFISGEISTQSFLQKVKMFRPCRG